MVSDFLVVSQDRQQLLSRSKLFISLECDYTNSGLVKPLHGTEKLSLIPTFGLADMESVVFELFPLGGINHHLSTTALR